MTNFMLCRHEAAEWSLIVREYQNLIGKIIIAIAIVVAGALIAQAISEAGSTVFSALDSVGTLIRDGLLQIGSAA